MKLIVCLFTSVFYFFFFAPGDVFAKLWINEFSSYASSGDWIELYNDDTNPIDLSFYVLRDESASNKVLLTGELQPGGFLEVSAKNYLNKDGDTIKIVYSNDETNIVDQVMYGNSGDSLAPQEGQSAGRSPDGSLHWVLFSNPSRSMTNGTSQIVPTPTLTPTKIPTPTRTPTPTKILTPTKVLTSTKIPTSSPTLSHQGAEGQVKAAVHNNSFEKKASDSSYPTPVLKNDITVSPTKKASEKKALIKESSANVVATSFLVGGGLFLAACAILVYRKIRIRNHEL